MSNEEMNKRMEFIVEQQAQFAADIQVMREIQAQDANLLKEQDRKLSDAVVAVVGMIGNLVQSQTRTDESIKFLIEVQARTEQRLNIFINVVERYISGTGGSESRA
jgi:hypothetical protein